MRRFLRHAAKLNQSLKTEQQHPSPLPLNLPLDPAHPPRYLPSHPESSNLTPGSRGQRLSRPTSIADQAVERAATMASVRNVLTEEQSAKLKELIAERTERYQEFREGGQDADRPFRRPGRRGKYQRRQGARDDQASSPRRGLNVDRLFERLDTDGDGKLTRGELEAMSERMPNRQPKPW